MIKSMDINVTANQVSQVSIVKPTSMSAPHIPAFMDIAMTLSMGTSAFVMLGILVSIVK